MTYGADVMNSIFIVASILVAPFIGGLLDGISRKITARLQNKIGPPITQPYIDFIKLSVKKQCSISTIQPVFAILHFILAAAAFAYFILGQDILKIIFIIVCSDISLILGAACVNSPYSEIAAKREAMTIMVFMLMLVMIASGVYLTTGSFMIGDILKSDERVIYKLPLLIYPLFFALLIRMRKSPLDLSLSCGRHQELGSGITLEFSPKCLAVLKLAKWFIILLVLGISSLLFSKKAIYGGAISLFLFFAAIVTDNITCRMSWQWTYKTILPLTLVMMTMNFLWFAL